MSLAQLIQATATSNNQARAEAEKNLGDAFKADPGLFIYACSQEFAGTNLDDNLRPQAAILLKYSLLNFEGGKLALWGNISAEARTATKNNLLSVLAYPNDIIRKTAADLIAIIYEMEAGQNIWDDLPQTLAENCKHTDIEIKKSAICTLGQICEKLKDKNGFGNQILENILMGICYGLEDNESDEIKCLALQALTDSLSFNVEFLKQDNYRKYAVALLLRRVSDQNSKDVIIKALQCLMEYVKLYYNYIEENLSTIWTNIHAYITENDPELAISALEVFDVIAREDKERQAKARGNLMNRTSLDIILKIESVLVPLLFQNLMDKNKYKDDEEGIINATKNCMLSVSGAIKDKFLEYNKEFVGTFILSNNLIEKRAALIAFACMLDGPSLEPLAALVTEALPTIANILSNENENMVIRNEAANALLATAENIPAVYIQEKLFLELLPVLVKSVFYAPNISISICKLWQALGEELGKREANIDLSELIDNLILNAFRDDIANPSDGFLILIDQTLLAVTILLKGVIKEDARMAYVEKLVQAFNKTGEVNGERRALIQTGILICLQILLYKLEFPSIPQILIDIYTLVVQMFEAARDVTPDGIHIIGALAASLGPNFKDFCEQALPFIGKGIQATTQEELFGASLEAVIHISGACPKEIASSLEGIIKILLNLLGDNAYNKEIKLSIIIAIGDLALGCKDLMAPFIGDIMKIYKMAMEAAMTIPPADQTEMQEYLENLREHLLESFVGFLHALDGNDGLIEHLEFVFGYMHETCMEKYDPTRQYIRNCLALIADIGYMFKHKVKNLVTSELTPRLIKLLNNFGPNQDYAQIISYTQEICSRLM